MPSNLELVLFWRSEISVKTKSSITGVKWKLKSGFTLSSPKYVSNDGILSDFSKEEDNWTPMFAKYELKQSAISSLFVRVSLI